MGTLWSLTIHRHLFMNRMNVKLHYGKTRLNNLKDLEGIDIVLTTYHTISAEWNSGMEDEKSMVFSLHWRRIVLDEG